MKALFSTFCGLVMIAAITQVAVAQDSAKEKQPSAKQTAKMQADLHRTMAELLVVRSADNPDQGKIDKLNEKLQKLRSDLAQTGQAAAGNQTRGGGSFANCPNPLGPLGPGPQAGQGRGRGQGNCCGNCPYGNDPFGDNSQGNLQGPGQGNGAGQGMGMGRGQGRGQGMGRGAGAGNGRGPGHGQGRGQGMGRGPGGPQGN